MHTNRIQKLQQVPDANYFRIYFEWPKYSQVTIIVKTGNGGGRGEGNNYPPFVGTVKRSL